jgi:hypothetical protein
VAEDDVDEVLRHVRSTGKVRDHLAEERRRVGSSSPWEGEGGGYTMISW